MLTSSYLHFLSKKHLSNDQNYLTPTAYCSSFNDWSYLHRLQKGQGHYGGGSALFINDFLVNNAGKQA